MVHLDTAAAEHDDALEQLVSGYAPLPGVFDEMMDKDGQVRPHWRPFLASLSALGEEEINRRFAAADRYLRDSGVFYRVHEDPNGGERPWPLSHIPLLVPPSEWKQLEAGLIQRAQLLEAVLADTYGPADLVREGRLPAALVAGNPEFLRPLVGVEPPGGAHLRFCALDIGRGADGKWWVLSDRAQAPSGAGYAIENRLALARAIPDIYRTAHVERLAPFFQSLQAELTRFNQQDNGRVCLLTPGPMNETYFEHAYLARYLGLLLVEGEDLTVRDDGVFIRTVSGLRRVQVLLRRLDADFADPLELNAASHLGVPGLVQAVRDGKVVIFNALGAGLIEARAMMAFMPALAPAVLGTELAISNIATWWLGRADAREEMIGKLDSMVIAPAFRDVVSEIALGNGKFGAELDETRREALVQLIRDRGVDYVAQEAVTLSSMPVWQDGKLQPRAFTLRLYLSKSGDHWQVMPGGFVRIAENADARAVSLQRGGATADAWVLSDAPVVETTLLPLPEQITIQRATGTLPSRAADNLFWVGRYVERSEATLRVVRALLNRISESEDTAAPVIARISELLTSWGTIPFSMQSAQGTSIAWAALSQREAEGSLPRLVTATRSAASVIRDRFSPDAWRALNDLVSVIQAPLMIGLSETAMIDRVEAALRIIASFSGLAQENMTQLAGWRFLELGRRIERAILTCNCIRRFADEKSADGKLDVMLELADSQITYRQRYVMIAALAPVIDLTLLDPNNPRSVAFQLERIEEHLVALPRHQTAGSLSEVQQVAVSIATRLRTAKPTEINREVVSELEQMLMKLSEAIASSYLTHNERSEAVWDTLA